MHSIQEDVEELQQATREEKNSESVSSIALLDDGAAYTLRKQIWQDCGLWTLPGVHGYDVFCSFPSSLKRLDLKIAIVFNYDAFRFEAWLAARNRKVQREYWELFKDSQWAEYRLVAPAGGIDSILECDLAKDFDLSDPDDLTSKIGTKTSAFIDSVESFLSEHQVHEEVVSAH